MNNSYNNEDFRCMMAQSEKMYRQQMEYMRSQQEDNLKMMQMMMEGQLKMSM